MPLVTYFRRRTQSWSTTSTVPEILHLGWILTSTTTADLEYVVKYDLEYTAHLGMHQYRQIIYEVRQFQYDIYSDLICIACTTLLTTLKLDDECYFCSTFGAILNNFFTSENIKLKPYNWTGAHVLQSAFQLICTSSTLFGTPCAFLKQKMVRKLCGILLEYGLWYLNAYNIHVLTFYLFLKTCEVSLNPRITFCLEKICWKVQFILTSVAFKTIIKSFCLAFTT